MDFSKISFITKVVDVTVPFAHDSNKSYIAGRIFQDRSRYYRVKYNKKVLPAKCRKLVEALQVLIEAIEQDRLQMLNQAFADSGIF